MVWSEFCTGRPNTRHATIKTPACPYCGAANPSKARPEEQVQGGTAQDETTISLISSSPSPPPTRRHIQPTRQFEPRPTPPSIHARRFNHFENFSRQASQARTAAFTRREHENRPHAGSNTHRSRQQGNYSSQPLNRLHQAIVMIYKCVKNLDGQIINRWKLLDSQQIEINKHTPFSTEQEFIDILSYGLSQWDSYINNSNISDKYIATIIQRSAPVRAPWGIWEKSFQEVLELFPSSSRGRQRIPNIILCMVAVDDNDGSKAGSNIEHDRHYNPLFDYDYPDLPSADIHKKSMHRKSPSPDHSIPWNEGDDDIFIKQEPDESDLDGLNDTKDIFENHHDDDNSQQKDTPLSGSIPASHIGHKRTISAVSAVGDDFLAPHEEEGADPFIKELMKSRSPGMKSHEQSEEEANVEAQKKGQEEAQKKERLGSLRASSLRNPQQKEVQNRPPRKKQVQLQEVPTDGPSSQTRFRKQRR